MEVILIAKFCINIVLFRHQTHLFINSASLETVMKWTFQTPSAVAGCVVVAFFNCFLACEGFWEDVQPFIPHLHFFFFFFP